MPIQSNRENLSIIDAEFCIDWIIDWIAISIHRLDFYRRIFIYYRFFEILVDGKIVS